MSAILYLNDAAKWPVQVILRQIVILASGLAANTSGMDEFVRPPEQTVKMAVIVIATRRFCACIRSCRSILPKERRWDPSRDREERRLVLEKKRYAPIIAGNYADPSIIRVGEDYYMTHSSYKLTPGLVIWHSRDLLNWSRVGPHYEGNVWAPDFVAHNGMYYIYYPAGRTNWVVTASSPAGPWSKPINLGIKGIDPGHTAGPDGKRYLHMSGGDFVELTADGLAIAGEVRHVYNGWRYPDDWVVEAYSLEGPKITVHDGYYYLTATVGGTAGPPTSHMAVSSRSRTPWGPWEHSPYNPIIHTESRDERWWSKGHASLIDSPDGQWWMVYHAYANGFHSLGRQTLLEPIEWTSDGWFRPQEAVRVLLTSTIGRMMKEKPMLGIKEPHSGIPLTVLSWGCTGSAKAWSLLHGSVRGIMNW